MTSAPASANISSVWVRVVTASRTVVGPSADSPANKMADFTWALATLEVQSIPWRPPPGDAEAAGSARRAPATVAPISPSGSATRSMGRSESDSSPTRRVSQAKPATNPHNNRMEVPELPQSSRPAGWCSWLRPPCSVTVPVVGPPDPDTHGFDRGEGRRRRPAPSERPCTTDVPSAKSASSTERCEIDFSPGVRTSPRQGTPPSTTRMRGAVMTGARPGSGTPWPRPLPRASPRLGAFHEENEDTTWSSAEWAISMS